MDFNQLVQYLDDHSKGLGILYTLLGGAIAASLFLAKPLLNYLFAGDAKKDDGKQTIVTVNTLDIGAIRELLAASRSDAPPQHVTDPAAGAAETQKRTIAENDVLNAAATLSKFRNLLKPSKLLSPDVFPVGMRVLKYDPEKLLIIALQVSPSEKGCLAAFTILHWTMFPGMAGFFLAQVLFGSPGTWIGGSIGAAIGIYWWARLTRNGPYLRIDLRRRIYTLINVGSVSWHNVSPTVEMQSAYEDNHWTATVRIAGHAVATTSSTKTQADAEKSSEPCVASLNMSLGNRLSIAEGVFIEPPKPVIDWGETRPS